MGAEGGWECRGETHVKHRSHNQTEEILTILGILLIRIEKPDLAEAESCFLFLERTFGSMVVCEYKRVLWILLARGTYTLQDWLHLCLVQILCCKVTEVLPRPSHPPARRQTS